MKTKLFLKLKADSMTPAELAKNIRNKWFECSHHPGQICFCLKRGAEFEKELEDALLQVRKDTLEEAASVAEKYAIAAGDYKFQVSKRRNSECIASAIRKSGGVE